MAFIDIYGAFWRKFHKVHIEVDFCSVTEQGLYGIGHMSFLQAKITLTFYGRETFCIVKIYFYFFQKFSEI